jgi:hypothetical protein
MIDGEEERNDVYRMVGVEVRKEDAVHSEGIQASMDHAAYRTRTEVEEERLTTGAHYHAALASLVAWNDGTGSYDGDIDDRSLRSLSNSAGQHFSLSAS